MLNIENDNQTIEFQLHEFVRDTGDYKVHKPYDKYFKNVMSIVGEGFMELIDYPIKIKCFHDSEKINEISGELHIDKLLESHSSKMYIVEFQMGLIRDKDLRRFGSYQALVYKETGLETIVIIIGLDAKEDSDELFGFGEFFDKDSDDENPLKIEYGFTPHVKSLTSLDLSLNLNIMDKIIENNEKPTEYELAILFAIPFMTDSLEKRKELIFKTAKMALELNVSDKNLLIEIGKNQIMLAQAVLSVDEFLRFMEVIRMSDEDFAYKIGMYIKQAKEEKAWKEGEELGEEKVVKRLLEGGFKVDEVLKYTDLSKSQILALSNSIVLK